MEKSHEVLNLYQNGQVMIERAAEVQHEHVQQAQEFLQEIVAAIVS